MITGCVPMGSKNIKMINAAAINRDYEDYGKIQPPSTEHPSVLGGFPTFKSTFMPSQQEVQQRRNDVKQGVNSVINYFKDPLGSAQFNKDVAARMPSYASAPRPYKPMKPPQSNFEKNYGSSQYG
jgi:hypothetical protein